MKELSLICRKKKKKKQVLQKEHLDRLKLVLHGLFVICKIINLVFTFLNFLSQNFYLVYDF